MLKHHSFLTADQIQKAIDKHGRFLQKKEKLPKIEVFEITNINFENKLIFLNGDSYFISEVEKDYEFLDEHPFKIKRQLIFEEEVLNYAIKDVLMKIDL